MNKQEADKQPKSTACISETSICMMFKSVLKENEHKNLNTHFLNQIQTHHQHTKIFLNSQDVHHCSKLIIDLVYHLRIRKRPTVIIVPRLQNKYVACRYKLYGMQYVREEIKSIQGVFDFVKSKPAKKELDNYKLSKQLLKHNQDIIHNSLHKNALILEIFYKIF